MRWTRRCRVRMRSQGEVKLVSDRERRARRAAFRGRSKRVVLAPVAGVKLVKACRPDRAQAHRQFADDGGKTNSSPGRARHKPLKPLRGECRMFPVPPL